MNIFSKRVSLIMICTLVFSSCTNLNETVFEEITTSNYYRTADEVIAAYLAVYGPLQDMYEEDYFNITEFSTDEASRPTKVQHGYDGGRWIRFHRHEWLANESMLEDVWNKCFKGIGFANTCLSEFPNIDFAVYGVTMPREQIYAEMRAMRAFYYYILCDNFGGVPIVEKVGDPVDPTRNTREEVVNYIEKELKEVIPNLPVKGDANSYGKMTRGAAWTTLAKVYLNSEAWTGKERWADCIDACDEVIASGKYQMDVNWQDPFHYFNENSRENILVIPYDQIHAKQMNYPGRFLHYAHMLTYKLGKPSSNGVGTEQGFLSKFKTNDKRYQQWLVGPQYDYDGKTPLPCVMELSGQNLVLNPVIKSMEEGAENSGARNAKFKIQIGTLDYPQDNDIPVFRYADILMMKAEALLRTSDKPNALSLINEVRARCFELDDPDRAYVDITLNEFLDERAREFSYECWRRQDLIRFGKFNDAWWDKKVSDATRKLFPIPDARIKANPKMKQNPGY